MFSPDLGSEPSRPSATQEGAELPVEQGRKRNGDFGPRPHKAGVAVDRASLDFFSTVAVLLTEHGRGEFLEELDSVTRDLFGEPVADAPRRGKKARLPFRASPAQDNKPGAPIEPIFALTLPPILSIDGIVLKDPVRQYSARKRVLHGAIEPFEHKRLAGFRFKAESPSGRGRRDPSASPPCPRRRHPSSPGDGGFGVAFPVEHDALRRFAARRHAPVKRLVGMRRAFAGEEVERRDAHGFEAGRRPAVAPDGGGVALLRLGRAWSFMRSSGRRGLLGSDNRHWVDCRKLGSGFEKSRLPLVSGDAPRHDRRGAKR